MVNRNLVNAIGWVLVICFLGSCADTDNSDAPLEFTCERRVRFSCSTPTQPATDAEKTLWWQQTQASKLFATTASHDFSAGALRVVDLVEGRVGAAEGLALSDARVRSPESENWLLVINRFPHSNLYFSEKDTLAIIQNKSVGARTNPADVIVYKDWIYVSRYGSKSLQTLRKLDFSLAKEHDLSKFADEDGIPEMNWMIRKGDKIYVQLQRMVRKPGRWIPAAKASVAVFDTKKDAFEDNAISLNGGNPVSEFKVDPDNNIYVATQGRADKLDGGVEQLGEKGFVVTEQELGGNVVDFVWVNKKDMVLIVETIADAKGKQKTMVVYYDTQKKRKYVRRSSDKGYYQSFSQLRYAANCNAVLVADRQLKQASVIPLEAKSFCWMDEDKFDLRLPPYHMDLGR